MGNRRRAKIKLTDFDKPLIEVRGESIGEIFEKAEKQAKEKGLFD